MTRAYPTPRKAIIPATRPGELARTSGKTDLRGARRRKVMARQRLPMMLRRMEWPEVL